MTQAAELLKRLQSIGVSITVDRDELVLRPASKVPPGIKDALRENKPELLNILTRPLGDAPPQLDRPPATEQELRHLIDHRRILKRSLGGFSGPWTI